MSLHDSPGGINSSNNTSWLFDITSTSTSTSSTSTSSTSSSTSVSSTSTSVSSTSTSISSTSTSVSSTSTSSTSTSISSTSVSTSSTSTSISTSSTSLSASTSSTSISSTSSSISSTSTSSTSTSTSTTTTIISAGVILICGSDIVWENNQARDYKEGFYAYAPVYIYIPDSSADVTVYFSTSGRSQPPILSYPFYGNRTNSLERNYAAISGYMNDFAHFTGAQENAYVCPAGSVITVVSINIAP